MQTIFQRLLICFLLITAMGTLVFCDGGNSSSDSDDDAAADDGTDDADDSSDDGSDADDTDDADDDMDVADDDYNPKGDFAVSDFASSGCLSMYRVVHEDGSYTIELDFLWDPAGILTVFFGSICYNCAYQPVIRYSVSPGIIDIYFNDPEGWGEDGMAACNCLFDYTFSMTGLDPGDYLIHIGPRNYFMRMPPDQSGHAHFYIGEGDGCG